ncbi:DUF1376 domain-containing protein [Duganella sp. FT50W]|uniref:DUF1376 domain-containing protein n=1 Tax=Duganella lactea TaxID=2692173 RepID=A0A6L8MKW2_9BURK|nr:DUF1376 domain-containing protein [Duganella lactea]
MNHYPHHIGDFDRATRHLTRLERSVYRDMMDIYYDTEHPLTLDVDSLCRRIIARTNEERTAVEQVLNEFFTKTERGWMHFRCEEVIEDYRTNTSQKSAAGRASAAKREIKRQQMLNASSTGVATDVEQTLNGTPTNHKPITNNHIKTSSSEQSPDSQADADMGNGKAAKKPKHTPADEACAQWLFDRIRKGNPDHKPPNIGTWAGDVRLMRERDGRAHREICELFGWAQEDAFWRANILSPAKLREKWDQLTIKRGTPQKGQKHDNFATQDYRAGVGADGSF